MKHNNEKEIKSFGNVMYMLKLLWEASPLRVCATLFRIITENVFFVFFFVYLTQYIFTSIEKRSKYSDLLLMISFACACHIGIHILSAWYNYYTSKNDPKIYKYIFDKIILKAEIIPLAKFEQPDFYDKFARVLDEAIDRAFVTLDSVANFFACVIAAIATAFLIVNVDCLLLLFTILPVISGIITGRVNGKLWYEMSLNKTRPNRVVNYTKRVFYEKKYAGEIRLYSIKELLFNKHKEAYDDIYKTDVRLRKKIVFYSIINDVIFERIFMFFGSIAYIAYRVTSTANILIAPYVAMINAVASMADNMESAIEEIANLAQHGAYIQNLREFLEYRSEETGKETTPITQPIDEIEMKNVTYTYEGAQKPVIDNLSIHIHKGEKIALVGHNGAGKTTIVKLLMGLYNVDSGEIIAGGNNITKYDSKEYHSKFGVIFQDFQIFSLPLAQNVLMKTPENDMEKRTVIEALRKAQFGEKLDKLPEGINTMVTKEFDDKGVGLSGGEAQKIAIARVFAKECDIAILDEPSSALDPIAEFNMYNNMMEVAKNKTVIFISHRLSSARMADKIYMLEKGKVIEQGTHEELMALNKKYAEMFNLQAQNYRDEDTEAAV